MWQTGVIKNSQGVAAYSASRDLVKSRKALSTAARTHELPDPLPGVFPPPASGMNPHSVAKSGPIFGGAPRPQCAAARTMAAAGRVMELSYRQGKRIWHRFSLVRTDTIKRPLNFYYLRQLFRGCWDAGKLLWLAICPCKQRFDFGWLLPKIITSSRSP